MSGADGRRQEECKMPRTPSFFWYELMTTDIEAARDFYTGVVGWRPEAWDGTDMSGRPYIVMNSAIRGVGGIMNQPEPMKAMGAPPAWVGYIYAADVDAATASVKAAGGSVFCEPADIPNVGRFSVVADPQGAYFQMLHPDGPDQPPIDPGTVGHVGWHELYTTDWKAAMAFYSSQYGWKQERAVDMGEMGTYAVFSVDGQQAGGMMNKPSQIPVPVWQFYFTVEAIDAAAKRVADAGGMVLMGPMEVPNGDWVAQCQDPQGAHFALTAARR
jgi:predicted enzyme related to lactoylglutathione lyase